MGHNGPRNRPPPRAGSSLASVSTICKAKWRVAMGPFQAQYARDRSWSLFHHGPAPLSHDQPEMDVRWMSSSIALLVSPEILKFPKNQFGGPASPVPKIPAVTSDILYRSSSSLDVFRTCTHQGRLHGRLRLRYLCTASSEIASSVCCIVVEYASSGL